MEWIQGSRSGANRPAELGPQIRAHDSRVDPGEAFQCAGVLFAQEIRKGAKAFELRPRLQLDEAPVAPGGKRWIERQVAEEIAGGELGGDDERGGIDSAEDLFVDLGIDMQAAEPADANAPGSQ